MEIRVLKDGEQHWPSASWPMRPICIPSESPPVQIVCAFAHRQSSVTCPKCKEILHG